jgi:hypothetical protein
MSFISELIKQELEGKVAKDSVTEALAAYREALRSGLNTIEADNFAQAVYNSIEKVELASSLGISKSGSISSVDNRTGTITYSLSVDGRPTTANSLVQLFRSVEGLTLSNAKKLVDGISEENPYLKEGLTKEQAEDLATRIRNVGGSVDYFQTKK